MKTFLAALLLAHLTASAFAQTADKLAVSASASATNTTTANNNIGRDVGNGLKSCQHNEMHRNSVGFIAVINDMTDETPDFFNRVMDGKKSSLRTDRGYPESFSNTILIVIDPANKVAVNQEKVDSYISAICAFPLGNEANVVVLDMTNFKDNEKTLMRKTILDKIGAKVTGQVSEDGKKLDLDTLLNEKQLNTIGLIAEDPTKPQELTPFHSADARYDEKVEALCDKAIATYNSWKKEAVARERREYPETVSWLITNMESNFEGRMASLIDGRGLPPDVNSEKLPHALLLVVDPANRLHGFPFLTDRTDAAILRRGNQAHVILLDMTDFNEQQKIRTREFLFQKLGKKIDAGKTLDGKPIDFASELETWGALAVLLETQDESKPGVLTPIFEKDARFAEKIKTLAEKGRPAYEAWKQRNGRKE